MRWPVLLRDVRAPRWRRGASGWRVHSNALELDHMSRERVGFVAFIIASKQQLNHELNSKHESTHTDTHTQTHTHHTDS